MLTSAALQAKIFHDVMVTSTKESITIHYLTCLPFTLIFGNFFFLTFSIDNTILIITISNNNKINIKSIRKK